MSMFSTRGDRETSFLETNWTVFFNNMVKKKGGDQAGGKAETKTEIQRQQRNQVLRDETNRTEY